jgi:hypothetical protein
MELAAAALPREEGLDLLAAHLAGLDPDTERARARLERRLGADLTRLLLHALCGRHAAIAA